MADPLRHNCKLDIAEEILNFIANSPDAKGIRETLRVTLEMNDADFKMAHDVVNQFRELIDGQEF